MASTMRWDPFQDLRAAQVAQDEMNQMTRTLAQALGLASQPVGTAAASATWAPALDIFERKDAYVVTVELPGVQADDLQITLDDGLLTIQGERHVTPDAADQHFHRIERRYGAFRRAITLPTNVMADTIEASVDNGVLQVVVPKMEEAKPTRIRVRSGARPAAVEGTAAATDAATEPAD